MYPPNIPATKPQDVETTTPEKEEIRLLSPTEETAVKYAAAAHVYKRHKDSLREMPDEVLSREISKEFESITGVPLGYTPFMNLQNKPHIDQALKEYALTRNGMSAQELYDNPPLQPFLSGEIKPAPMPNKANGILYDGNGGSDTVVIPSERLAPKPMPTPRFDVPDRPLTRET